LGQRTVRNRLPPPPDSSISITYSSPLVAVRSPSAPRPAPHKALSPSSSRPPRSATPPRSRSDSLSAHPRVRCSPCSGGINRSVVTVTVYRPGCLNVMVRFGSTCASASDHLSNVTCLLQFIRRGARSSGQQREHAGPGQEQPRHPRRAW